ncbi:LPD29 domain-containing protein [Streptomyces sp. NBC_01304]|uniref:LPD29 domain-containing protein n=1 Tax=Streptomyces sp. NBC_01304 TaxID=2903818 RepID=UPI002E13B86E|nr:hypothetical protein OG430_48750 [Streptomyces sp. NBC_01304]
MTALITPAPDGHLSIPERAARYKLELKEGRGWDEWQAMDDVAMPDGALSGAGSELAASVFLVASEGIAFVDDGVLTITGERISFRLTPDPEWQRLTPAHPLAPRYSVEATQAGRGSWTTQGLGKTTATADEVRELAEVCLRGRGDAAVHPSGVIIVDGGAVNLALRLTPIAEPSFRQERWTSRDVAKYLRKHLRRAFPGQKISVRCGRGTVADNLSIKWTGGPTVEQVAAICEPWQGADFDVENHRMIEREPVLFATEEGDLVEIRPLTDLFTYTRSRSEAVTEQAKCLVARETERAWDAVHFAPRAFTFQGRTFWGDNALEQLNQVMDALEAGAISVA